jgi:hypothetical protein
VSIHPSQDLSSLFQLIHLFFNCLGFLLQFFEVILQPGNLLFLGHEAPLECWRAVAAAKAAVMPPALHPMMMTMMAAAWRFTTHALTPLHIKINVYAHTLIFNEKKRGSVGHKVFAQGLPKCLPVVLQSILIKGVMHEGSLANAPDHAHLPQDAQVLGNGRLGNA